MLNRDFFEHAAGLFGPDFLICKAALHHQAQAVAVFWRDRERLYGRYWGSVQDIDCLHFNACYYSPIEWAIANGVNSFDPGAGGRHKKRRGFPARPNYSLHRFYDGRLAKILRSYIDRINDMERQEIDYVNQDLPFRIGTSSEV